jgi:hypothetical protein
LDTEQKIWFLITSLDEKQGTCYWT